MIQQKLGMGVMEAIQARRSVRAYTDAAIDRETLGTLLTAATQAPTAMHEEPWVFTVVQDKEMLRDLSEASKATSLREGHGAPLTHMVIGHQTTEDPAYDIFHGAATLVVIWAKPVGAFAAGDCWLAAENLMLAACAMGLGTCVIGFAASTLNMESWKVALGVPSEWSAIAPIIIGEPSGQTAPVPRKPVEIVSWRENRAG